MSVSFESASCLAASPTYLTCVVAAFLASASASVTPYFSCTPGRWMGLSMPFGQPITLSLGLT
ncbi:hypothetical protein ADK70_16445 [Streptomyces rimosus subsp. pseudoverticillatus]|nr:hypothetical protein ADK70_16445 [Streptomyces rimosus subsp. pseudoverticillatus]